MPQLCNENKPLKVGGVAVALIVIVGIVFKFEHPANMVVIVGVPVNTKPPMDLKPVQVLNMLVKFVPATVFKLGIEVKARQFKNMDVKLVPAVTTNEGIVRKDWQESNILVKF